MPYKVAALYQFVPLPDFRALRAPLCGLCDQLGLKGTLLLAPEGINGTLAGEAEAIDRFMSHLQRDFDHRFDGLELKFSLAAAMPFRKMKVRLKKEIVTLGAAEADPRQQVGTYVDAKDWNALIADPDVLLIDTRNDFEVAMGTFTGALDPQLRHFSDFKDFTRRALDPAAHRKIAMFCTGGIRCEKASAYLLAQGFDDVYHLKGGILKYLETIPEGESLWRGSCFVFDKRVALGHGLREHPSACAERSDV